MRQRRGRGDVRALRGPALRGPGVPARDIRPADPGGSAPRHGVGVPGRRPPRPPLGPDRRADRRRTAAHDPPALPSQHAAAGVLPAAVAAAPHRPDLPAVRLVPARRPARLPPAVVGAGRGEVGRVRTPRGSAGDRIAHRRPAAHCAATAGGGVPRRDDDSRGQGFHLPRAGRAAGAGPGGKLPLARGRGPAGPRFVRRGGPRLRGRGPGRRRVRAHRRRLAHLFAGVRPRLRLDCASGPNTGWKNTSPPAASAGRLC